MTRPPTLPDLRSDAIETAWRQFDQAIEAARGLSIDALLQASPEERLRRLLIDAAGLRLDLSRQRVPLAALEAMERLAQACAIPRWRDAMFAGDFVNASEGRPALHGALRADAGGISAASEPRIGREVAQTLDAMTRVAEAVRSGQWRGATGRPISDVVNVGIGGSQLGPQLACEALADSAHRRLRIHFLGNVDPAAWRRIAEGLNPATTLFVIASKSWRTPETARNAEAIRHWLLAGGIAEESLSQHLLGVSSNHEAARRFGIADEHLFSCPEWVGGRYSLWGAIGLPVMISIGASAFRQMLAGAQQMDRHFLTAPVLSNAPMMLALASAWNARLLPRGSEAVIAYSDRLRRFAAHLQQLQMESNGKSVLADGSGPASRAAMPVIWGEPGTESQHSFFQALHQGPSDHAIDVILIDRESEAPDAWARDRALLANALAQSRALAIGHQVADRSRCHPGNRPVTLIHLERLNPASFGALVALYEHKTACLGWLWGLNPFDQWGVELGKRMAEQFEAALSAADAPPSGGSSPHAEGLDPASQASLTRLQARIAR
jgi:glucose-6-phosphate isomerase